MRSMIEPENQRKIPIMQKKGVRLRGQPPVNSVVISGEGTSGSTYASGHRRLAEYGIRCKGGLVRQLTCIGCGPFDLLIGD